VELSLQFCTVTFVHFQGVADYLKPYDGGGMDWDAEQGVELSLQFWIERFVQFQGIEDLQGWKNGD
jgi:hypothetical protein